MIDFDKVYAQGGWDGYGSGMGSTPLFCHEYNIWLAGFMRDRNIQSVLDLGCGDWQSTRLIDWSGIDYWGIDIVARVIERNQQLFRAPNLHFIAGDFLNQPALPKADLLVVKDVIHHLDHADVRRTVNLAKRYPLVLWVVDMGLEVPHGSWPDLDLIEYFKPLPHVFEFDTRVPGYKYGPKSVLLSSQPAQSAASA
jgi:SAM-dependent methyltransferase